MECCSILFRPFKALKEPFCAGSHLLGAIAALIATITLAIDAASNNYSLVGSLTFGVTLFFLLIISTLVHGLHCSSDWSKRLEKLDYVAIYFFIAGTYTPLCLKVLPGTLGTSLLIGQWVLAIVGSVLVYKSGLDCKRRQVIIYLLLGWSFIIAARSLYQNLNGDLFSWLLIGGFMYSIGSLFFLNSIFKTIKFGEWDHAIWHLFVLAGGYCHFRLVAGICIS